ncbi:MAG: glutamate-5-semialdehyde dehydrogenase [Hellea sp.]|nr:glutamate-5-semialdehyde dehydrogenase [Hellea sp.]
MTTTLTDMMADIGREARQASQILALATASQKNQALIEMARRLRQSSEEICEANRQDVTAAAEKGLSPAMIDRLLLSDNRIESMASSLESISAMDDPVGKLEASWQQPNGLKFSKVKIPIGVIGMIYESRPNVTADAGALCLKAGNACILRGGSESLGSNKAIYKALLGGLKAAGLPETSIQLIPTSDRSAVGMLLGGLNDNVDLIIPRGGKGLIARVQSDARVPVLAHLEGLCHSYIHQDADPAMAQSIVVNAKMRRTGVCGSTETLLIDRAIAGSVLPEIVVALVDSGCEIRGDDASRAIASSITKRATEEDFRTEYLAPVISVKIVEGVIEAIGHINSYGSGHTDAIITENQAIADQFQREVDSSIVMHNASTQFADGGEFGFGAEIGISTGRLHARGPVGAEHLTTFKYLVHGSGQVRPE